MSAATSSARAGSGSHTHVISQAACLHNSRACAFPRMPHPIMPALILSFALTEAFSAATRRVGTDAAAAAAATSMEFSRNSRRVRCDMVLKFYREEREEGAVRRERDRR